MTNLVVTAIAGRESITARTLVELRDRGGALDANVKRTLFWTSLSPPPTVAGWRPLWLPQKPRVARDEVWWLLRDLQIRDPYADLILVEDDVEPCRNLIPYLEQWRTPPGAAFTTFFNGRRLEEGLHPALAPDGRGFWFSQCLKLPASFLARAAATDVNAGRYSCGQDVALGVVAHDAGLGVWYHPSLVQHVGHQSTIPGQTLTGKRAPACDFVGAEFDALSML